jgi:hypothetical protein
MSDCAAVFPLLRRTSHGRDAHVTGKILTLPADLLVALKQRSAGRTLQKQAGATHQGNGPQSLHALTLLRRVGERRAFAEGE